MDKSSSFLTLPHNLGDRRFDETSKPLVRGIGVEKRDYINRAIDPVTLDLMRAIKRQFDPKGLLNPDKVFPPAQA